MPQSFNGYSTPETAVLVGVLGNDQRALKIIRDIYQGIKVQEEEESPKEHAVTRAIKAYLESLSRTSRHCSADGDISFAMLESFISRVHMDELAAYLFSFVTE